MNICHLFPGLTPMNIGDVPYGQWVQFALSTDAHGRAVEKARASRH